MAESRRRRIHRAWFVGLLSAVVLVQSCAALVAMLPLAMATDPCHDGTPDRVCRLSAAGQNFLLLIPWLALLIGLAVTVAAAVLAERGDHSPLLALPIGIIGYLAAMPLGWQLAFTL